MIGVKLRPHAGARPAARADTEGPLPADLRRACVPSSLRTRLTQEGLTEHGRGPGLRRRQGCARREGFPRGLRELFPAHFSAVVRDVPTVLAIESIGSPPLALLRMPSILPAPTAPLWPSSRRKPKQRYCRADCGWLACPCPEPKASRARARNFQAIKPATSRLSNTDEEGSEGAGEFLAAVLAALF